MTSPVQISIDSILIGRCLLALVWGILYAVFLQQSRVGQFLSEKRTWLATVIGVGVDLLIAFDGDWWTVAAVISLSSLGIIGRSAINEQAEDQRGPRSYKVIWGLEDAIAFSRELVEDLTNLLERGRLEQDDSLRAAKALALAHRIKSAITAARRGEYEYKRVK